MKKILIAFCAVGIFGSISFGANPETKIGFVDVPKAIQATAAGKKAKNELESAFKLKKKELDKKETDLKKMGEDLQKKKSVLSEEVMKHKEIELQSEMLKFREEVAKSQAEIQKKQQELTGPIFEKMQKVIAKVSKAKGLTIVLQNSQAVLFAKPELDFTQEVVNDFNKEK